MTDKKTRVIPGVVDITDLDYSKLPQDMLIQGKDRNIKVPYRLKITRDGISEEYMLEVLDKNDKVYKDQIGFAEDSSLPVWEGNKHIVAKELIKNLLHRLPEAPYKRELHTIKKCPPFGAHV